MNKIEKCKKGIACCLHEQKCKNIYKHQKVCHIHADWKNDLDIYYETYEASR